MKLHLKNINPFDILSGKVVQNHYGTFWFKEPGNNLDKDGYPIHKNLYNENGPVIISVRETGVWKKLDRYYFIKNDNSVVPTYTNYLNQMLYNDHYITYAGTYEYF